MRSGAVRAQSVIFLQSSPLQYSVRGINFAIECILKKGHFKTGKTLFTVENILLAFN